MSGEPCRYFHFGLIVTGKSEQEHLPQLFVSLTVSGICTFEVIRRIGQRSPITSEKRKITLVGSGKTIPNKDEEEIGFPARRYLLKRACGYVIVIDDLEYERRPQAAGIFARYRLALDTLLGAQKYRASVHFFVNMLEAYYFADAQAVNQALGRPVLQSDYEGDVEELRHPKNDLKHLYPNFDEKDDGGKILSHLDVEHVLSRPDTCLYLRTLFAWCVKVLASFPYFDTASLRDKYQLHEGRVSTITGQQLLNW